MEIRGIRHAAAAFSLVPIINETRWTEEMVWTMQTISFYGGVQTAGIL
jgi:hypothetical protein